MQETIKQLDSRIHSMYHIGLILQGAGGGADTPAVHKIGCHFSGIDPKVLKFPDFFKNDVGPKVKESFLAYLE